MFQGIAVQINEATKEVRQQKVLRDYVETLEKQEKVNNRLKKKAESNVSRLFLPNISLQKLEQFTSLRALFFKVFEKQENEKVPSRAAFLSHFLFRTYIDDCTAIWAEQITSTKPVLKHGREVNSLEILLRKIKNGTKEKYYSHEVLTMLQFIERYSEALAFKTEIERALSIGKTAHKHLKSVIENLHQEKSWGSWELITSKKINPNQIPPSEIDQALAEIPVVSAYLECFYILLQPFLGNRNQVLHSKNLQGLFHVFVDNMIKDWIYADKIKTVLSSTNQVMNSIKALIYELEAMNQRNNSEIDLLKIETNKRVEETGKLVERRMKEGL